MINKTVLSVSLVCITLFLTGCSTVIVEGSGNKDVISSAPVTIHGSMYGFDWQNKKNVLLAMDKDDRTQSIYSVECHTNYLYLLTGVLTLGFYYPQTFEYTLVVPEQYDDED